MKEVSKKTGIIIWTFISIFLGIGYALICKKFNVYHNNLFVERIIAVFLISEFIGLNVIIGFRKLWDFIIDKRYIIALICLVLFSVLGINGSSMGANTFWILEPENSNVILGNFRYICSDEYAVEVPFAIEQKNNGMNYFSRLNGIFNTDMNISIHTPTKSLITLFRIYNIGYFFLNSNIALSLAWNLKVISSILVTFEFMRILTKDKKYLSLVGTILVVCSSFISWWTDMASVLLIFGELAIISIDKFMISKNKKMKTIWSLVLAYSIISYVFSLYPAWIISFGYVFLAIAIWIIIKNKKEYKFEIFDIFCYVGILLIIGAVGFYFYNTSFDSIQRILNSVYPGSRNESGGKGIIYLFSYLYSSILPFGQEFDTKMFASFLSFFPIPMIMAMIYLYKKEKHVEFILPLLIVLVLETVWCVSGIPNSIAKIVFLNLVPVERCAVAIELGSIYLYIYMLAHVDEKFIKQTNAVYIILAVLVLVFFMPVPDSLKARKFLYMFVAIETLGGFLLLNIGDKKYQKVFLFFAVLITLISGITVNPIAMGVEPITETNFSKVVQQEVRKRPDLIWITENMDMPVSNYLVSQDAKTLNATQTYPQEEFWKIVLEDSCESYREIWNRYAHIKIQLIDDGKPYIRLLTNDCIEVYLTPNKLQELNVHYIVSYKNNLEEKVANLKKIYSNEISEVVNIDNKNVSGIYIYNFVN